MRDYTIHIDEPVSERLREAASARRISVEELIATAAEWWLADRGPEPAWSDEDVAVVEAGIAQLARGQVISQEALMVRLKAKYDG